jgi:integrase/recombinase XerD
VPQADVNVDSWIALLRERIKAERYSRSIARKYPPAARSFLRDLVRRGRALHSVSVADVEQYIHGLVCARSQHALPVDRRREHRAAIRMLLRLVHDGNWPAPAVPITVDEIAIQEIVTELDTWMTEVRGLAAGTRGHGRFEAHSLLRWLHDRGRSLPNLCVADLDAYIASRVLSMRRRSKVTMIGTLRGVLRYLHHSGRIPADLTGAIEAPPIYALEHIPSTIRQEDIDRMLEAACRDRSPLGRRDWAILNLLTTYGLRSGEVVGLCVSDIDWRNDRLRIRHTKTGACSDLPLLRGPADALLDYLKYARPETAHREVFLRAQAPYQALTRASLNHVMARRLQAAGVSLPGKRGPHVLRHSRAASLLNGGLSIKLIGDVLGHRSNKSTVVYLKLANDDLKAVALELPQEVPA